MFLCKQKVTNYEELSERQRNREESRSSLRETDTEGSPLVPAWAKYGQLRRKKQRGHQSASMIR
jgi:hypothetical protein